MGIFSGVNSTEISLDTTVGFSASEFQAMFANAGLILDKIVESSTLGLAPTYVGLNNENPALATEGWADFSNGLHVWGAGSSSGSYATLTEISADYSIDSAVREMWMTGPAKAYITPSSIAAQQGISPEFDIFSLGTQKEFGLSYHPVENSVFGAVRVIAGSLTFNPDLGAISGTASSYMMVLANDSTPETNDAYYLKVIGKLTQSPEGAMSGTISGYEYGTITNIFSDGNAVFTKLGGVGGLKLDAATTIAAIDSSGSFDILAQGLYAGNDTITGTAGSDNLNANTGNDKLYGLGGDDTLKGCAGNDLVEGGAGADTMNGGTGNDKLYGHTVAAVASVDDGDDLINGWSGNDTIYAGNGNDSVTGGAGNDKIYGGDGNDSIGGDLNPAYLADYGIDDTSPEYTVFGNDAIYGEGGNDTLNGGGGNDKLYGGDGNDSIYGDRTTDPVEFSGNDLLDGGSGNDILYGFRGIDKLLGGAGTDFLSGGYGNDGLTGGADADYFLFNSQTAYNGIDKITDFVSGTDKLWFYTFDAIASGGRYYTDGAGIALTADNFTTAAVAQDANDYLLYSQGKLYFDADANGAGAAIQIAEVKGLTVTDLIFGTDYTGLIPV